MTLGSDQDNVIRLMWVMMPTEMIAEFIQGISLVVNAVSPG